GARVRRRAPRPRCDRCPPRRVPRRGAGPPRAAAGARPGPAAAGAARLSAGRGPRRHAGPGPRRHSPRTGAAVVRADRRSPRSSPELSVVIPAFNEAARLPRSLLRIREYLDAQRRPYELIVVDDGSRDGTAERAREAGGPALQLVVNEANRGK